MFELSLANWPPVARILQEDVSVAQLEDIKMPIILQCI